MTSNSTLSTADVLRIVNRRIDALGASEFARQAGVSRQYVTAARNGDKSITERMLSVCGIRRVVTVRYEMENGE